VVLHQGLTEGQRVFARRAGQFLHKEFQAHPFCLVCTPHQEQMGKSFDTFCPMGPWLVSADECDGANTGVRCFVNGEKRQDARTTELIFNIPTLIETLSAGITLYPGDIIATGTSVGVGIDFKPPKYLKTGDVVRIEIDGIGHIENPVR
jgi:2-keto-4-pentenoate hydratase/2-oxohepta-3-ene-1,7-dioic acid hydratase in catechol pathway